MCISPPHPAVVALSSHRLFKQCCRAFIQHRVVAAVPHHISHTCHFSHHLAHITAGLAGIITSTAMSASAITRQAASHSSKAPHQQQQSAASAWGFITQGLQQFISAHLQPHHASPPKNRVSSAIAFMASQRQQFKPWPGASQRGHPRPANPFPNFPSPKGAWPRGLANPFTGCGRSPNLANRPGIQLAKPTNFFPIWPTQNQGPPRASPSQQSFLSQGGIFAPRGPEVLGIWAPKFLYLFLGILAAHRAIHMWGTFFAQPRQTNLSHLFLQTHFPNWATRDKFQFFPIPWEHTLC